MRENVVAFPAGPTLREALDGPNGEKIRQLIADHLRAKGLHMTVEDFLNRPVSEGTRRRGAPPQGDANES
jgi:hypothetical protein